ncbi:hypothetical protein CUJ84_pRLN4000042 (plasmid) [Rhizobium leguminosarum]|uniref:Uncharacterized protein n=1 Tax=Rhizobium leguminosarum TaxID=384 RepID=A0A2K9ZHP6_RHILE|nr:hypothetical protein CUJ84_pRLN4000042 [Rhizobium leguminosarum]
MLLKGSEPATLIYGTHVDAGTVAVEQIG